MVDYVVSECNGPLDCSDSFWKQRVQSYWRIKMENGSWYYTWCILAFLALFICGV